MWAGQLRYGCCPTKIAGAWDATAFLPKRSFNAYAKSGSFSSLRLVSLKLFDWWLIVKIGSGKTRKVRGVDLNSACFAHVPDIEDSATWRVALYFPGRPELARASILDALGRFEQMRSTWIPSESVQRIYDTLRGAAIAHGIHVERLTFEQQPATPAPAPVLATNPDEDELSVKELRRHRRNVREYEAMADKAAEEVLAALGLE